MGPALAAGEPRGDHAPCLAPPCVLPAGAEKGIPAWLSPLVLGGPIAGGVRLQNVRLDSDHLVLEVAASAQATLASLEVRVGTAAANEVQAGLLVLRPGAGVTPDVVSAVAAVLALKKRGELPWVALPAGRQSPRKGPSRHTRHQPPPSSSWVFDVRRGWMALAIFIVVGLLVEHLWAARARRAAARRGEASSAAPR